MTDSTVGLNSTKMIESTDESESSKQAEPLRRVICNRPKTDFFGHDVMITQTNTSPRSVEEASEN